MGVELTIVGTGPTGSFIAVLNPGLSSLFQKLFCRYNTLGEESELFRFSAYSGIDLSPLMEMDQESEDATSADLYRYSEYAVQVEPLPKKSTLNHNLTAALDCISRIADYLQKTPSPLTPFIENLSAEMQQYFSGDLKSEQSFVSDLGNLHQTLIQIQASGATSVYFVYQ